MIQEGTSSEFRQAIAALPQTDASLAQLPPDLLIATGYEDEVLLFLVRIGNADAAIRVLMSVNKLSEASSIATTLAATNGLINKRFHIDAAQRLKLDLEAVDTSVEFIRPDETGK